MNPIYLSIITTIVFTVTVITDSVLLAVKTYPLDLRNMDYNLRERLEGQLGEIKFTEYKYSENGDKGPYTKRLYITSDKGIWFISNPESVKVGERVKNQMYPRLFGTYVEDGTLKEVYLDLYAVRPIGLISKPNILMVKENILGTYLYYLPQDLIPVLSCYVAFSNLEYK